MTKVMTIDEVNALRDQALATKSFKAAKDIFDIIASAGGENNAAMFDSPEAFELAMARLAAITDITDHFDKCTEV